jgi:hypothetical protein
MLSDSRGSVIISSLGWVDRGSLWIMSVGSGRIETVFLQVTLNGLCVSGRCADRASISRMCL